MQENNLQYAIHKRTSLPPKSRKEILSGLRKKKFRKNFFALSLVAPLFLLLLLVFIVPIFSLLIKAVDSPEVLESLPRTIEQIGKSNWQGDDLPDDSIYKALVEDLIYLENSQDPNDVGKIGRLAKRLNHEIAGFRSLIIKTSRRLNQDTALDNSKELLISIDSRWSENRYWRVIERNSNRYTLFYALASLDLTYNEYNEIVSVDQEKATFINIFIRTIVTGIAITLSTLVLAFPLAYWMSHLSTSKVNIVMIFILGPFWISVLVRITSWIVILQNQGIANKSLIWFGVIDEPLELIFNKIGVFISMTHILLPFMILPIYNVMQAISKNYQKAAISLGSHPFGAFWKVFVPQTYPGIGAGCVMVFIVSIGYYITPALLGGARDQMISYYIAYFTNTVLNWGMASALGSLLLITTIALYIFYDKFLNNTQRNNT